MKKHTLISYSRAVAREDLNVGFLGDANDGEKLVISFANITTSVTGTALLNILTFA